MKSIIACIAAAMAMVLVACHSPESSNDKTSSVTTSDMQLDKVYKQEEGNRTLTTDTISSPSTPPNLLQSGSPVSPDWDKKIIKTADVRLELKDYNRYNNAIHKSLKTYGAYIASEEQTQNDESIENSLSIKVPVDRFEDLMNTFSGDDIKVIQKKISTADVTTEVVDTKGRIHAKQAAREKYIEFLRSAKNMKDMLQVQTEINSLQEDLEAANSRVNYLVNQSSYSTINLSYYQTLLVSSGEVSRLNEAFSNGTSIIVSFLLFLVTIWPFLLASILIWFLVKRYKLPFAKAPKKA